MAVVSTGFAAKPAAAPPTTLQLPPALTAPATVTNQALLTEAQKLLPAGAYLGPLLDETYAVVPQAWLKEQFLPFYRREVARVRQLGSEDAEASDCDNYGTFIRHTLALAGWIGHTAQPAVAHVIVFQEKAFSGLGRTRERHSVCLILTDAGWQVIEPQNAARLTPLSRYPNRDTIQFIAFH